jgi:hypothetical protein
MPELNANVPPIECYVRGNFLKNQEKGHGEYYPCYIFGVASIPDRVPMFHFLMEDGGIWWRMPINAFCSTPDVPEMDIHDLVLWNSFSPFVTVTTFNSIKGMRMTYKDRHKVEHSGKYITTLDWHNPEPNIINTNWSENPGQHKCAHLIELDNGNYALQPNNRIILKDPSFTTKIGSLVTERILNTHLYSVEDADKWITEDSENYYYDVEKKK